MNRIFTVLCMIPYFLTANCQTIKMQKDKKKNKATQTVYNIEDFAILPKDYQILLGKGMDVDWVKTGQGKSAYNVQIVKAFKKIGLSHVRIRIKDHADEKLLKHLDKVVTDCLVEGLIPVIAYQGAEFKGEPTEQNLSKIVKWWVTVSDYFKNKSHKVSYDLLIEVTEALNKKPEMLNSLYEKTVAEIRKSNPTRIVFISPIIRSAPEHLKDLKIPTQHNNYLMAEWHFYASGPDKSNEEKKWTTGTEAEKELIRSKIRTAMEWQKKTGIYTWVGAWMTGNYNKGDEYTVAEQVVFANFVTCELTKNKIPFSFNSDTKFYSTEKNNWLTNMKPVLDEILKANCK